MAARKDGKPKKNPEQPYRIMTPENRALVVAGRIQEKSCREISREIGCNPKSITNLLKKDEIKELIERETSEIIKRGLIPARRTITRFAAMGTNPDATDVDKKLALEASKHITGIAGVSGTTPSVVINTLTQINQQGEQTKQIKAFGEFLMQKWAQDMDEVVDV